MIDSDFSIGFKQGQQHGKQIMLEKIEYIKTEIKNDARSGMNERYCDGLRRALKIIDKHISGKEQE